MSWRWAVQDWIKKINDVVAICSYCSKDVSVAIMKEAALTSHMKGKKHIERSSSDHCMKSLMLPVWLYWKLVCLESGVPINNPLWSYWELVCLESGASNCQIPSQILF